MKLPVTADPRGENRFFAVVYGGFFFMGVGTVLLGPLLPELRARWDLTAAQAGSLFVAQFVASSVGAVFSSFHLRWSLIVSYAAAGAGLLLLAFGGWSTAWLALALIGLGLGLGAPATNLLVAARYTLRRGAALARANLVWGIGAVTCPLIFAALLGRVPTPWILLGMSLPTLAVAVALAVVPAPRYAGGGPADDAAPAADGEDAAPAASVSMLQGMLRLVPAAAMMFFYVGIETTFSGWLVSLAEQLHPGHETQALLVGACFWAAFLSGRASAPWALRYLSEAGLFWVTMGIAGVGTVVILLSGPMGLLAVGAALTGAGLSPIFPLVASIIATESEASGSRGGGWPFAFAGIGGAVLPWIAGDIADHYGSLTPGFLVSLAGLAGLAAVLFTYRRFSQRWE